MHHPPRAIRVEPGRPAGLHAIDPHPALPDDARGSIEERARGHLERLDALQECLYAGRQHALLLVLQGMDTAGKDGVIRHVCSAFDPQGVAVTPFRVPTPEELSHDFLWRIHKAVPARGMVGVFNRSHYEDVVTVPVLGLAPEAVWQPRFEAINTFERALTEAGVTIVKLFLHISPAEQEERLRRRQERPDKRWKFNPGDLEMRKLWSRFAGAWEVALTRCSTPWAPWHVVPSDRKWLRDALVAELLVGVLEGLDLRYPDAAEGIESLPIPPAE